MFHFHDFIWSLLQPCGGGYLNRGESWYRERSNDLSRAAQPEKDKASNQDPCYIQFRVIALCFRQKIFNFLLPVKLQPCLCKVLWKLPVWACSFRGPVRFTIYFLFAWQRTFDCLPNSHLSLGHLPSENLFLLFVFAERELDFYVVPSSFSFFYKDRKKVGEE